MTTESLTRSVNISEEGPTILVLDDDESLATLVRRMLEMKGYRVITANDPDEALMLVQRHSGAISLFLTDMVLQGMTGLEVAMKLKDMRPKTKILFMSGDRLSVEAASVGQLLAVLRRPQ
jgi:two-component system cell cycle sensor histidine kinase/response regulator CckA